MIVRIRGADSLASKLEALAKMEHVKNVVQRNGAEMQRHAKILAPVDTGFLKRQIRMVIENGGFTVKVISGGPPKYAIYQERKYTPHVIPALNRQKQKFLRDVRRAVNGG